MRDREQYLKHLDNHHEKAAIALGVIFSFAAISLFYRPAVVGAVIGLLEEIRQTGQLFIEGIEHKPGKDMESIK